MWFQATLFNSSDLQKKCRDVALFYRDHPNGFVQFSTEPPFRLRSNYLMVIISARIVYNIIFSISFSSKENSEICLTKTAL